jgi:Flp pilus assembly protein CpaB
VRSERATLPRQDGAKAVEGVVQRRRVGRPRRLTSGSVVPIVMAVLAAGFAYAALQDRSAMTNIVVASSRLAAGSPVNGTDTRTVRVHATDEGLVRGVLSPSAVGRGWVAAVAVQIGEPITASEVREPATGPVMGQMSIAVPVQQAAGGTIAPGDRVDVIASQSDGGARYVAQSLPVVSVAPTSPAGGVLSGGSVNYFVVVAVDKQAALQISAALGSESSDGAASDIEIIRSTGERVTAQVGYPGTGGATPATRAVPRGAGR